MSDPEYLMYPIKGRPKTAKRGWLSEFNLHYRVVEIIELATQEKG